MFKVSVIIPVYNAESTLNVAINSVINQTIGFENIELILVDDNSTDNSKKIIEDHANKYSNIKPIFLSKNSGSPSKPRNIGIDNVNSDYLMFLDNDDEYFENYCEVMYEKIVENEVDIVHCEHVSKLNNKFYIPKHIEKINAHEEFLNNENKLLIDHYAWGNIFRTSLVRDNDIKFPATLYEDGVFSINCFLNTNKIIYLTDFPGYIYLIENENSISHNVNIKTLFGFIEGYKLCENLFNQYNHINAKHELFKSYITMALFILMKLDELNDGINMLFEFEKSLDFEIELKSKPLNVINNKIINKQFKQASLLLKIMGFFYNNKKIRNYLFVRFSNLKLLKD